MLRHMELQTANPFERTAGAVQILIVDDDPAIRKVVQYRLEAAGYQVWVATGGLEALEIVDKRGLPHLAVIDVMMPDMNGFDLCEQLLAYSDLPVIMLTAVSDEQTVVRGIRLFAEDYITKPFRPSELLARVERVLRRMSTPLQSKGALIPVDSLLAIDLVHQRVQLEGQWVDLTPTETKLLHILIRNAGRPVTSDFLLQRLWPSEERYEDILRVHIHRLRQKIEPDPRSPRYILTERELGYCFAEKVA
jgi:DNA-binding response OmpR family regulator